MAFFNCARTDWLGHRSSRLPGMFLHPCEQRPGWAEIKGQTIGLHRLSPVEVVSATLRNSRSFIAARARLKYENALPRTKPGNETLYRYSQSSIRCQCFSDFMGIEVLLTTTQPQCVHFEFSSQSIDIQSTISGNRHVVRPKLWIYVLTLVSKGARAR